MNPALQVQAARAELGLGELELPGHVRQVTANVAPVLVEYVPAAQSVHAALPVLILYLPATQAEQTPPFGPVNPALQVQSPAAELALYEIEFEGHVIHVVEIVAPVLVEYVPAPQSVHDALPLVVLYLPATQAVHEPAGPVNPALQVVSPPTHTLAPAVDVLPAGQAVHVVAPLFEYVFAGQLLQVLINGVHSPYAFEVAEGLHSQQYGHAPSGTHQLEFIVGCPTT